MNVEIKKAIKAGNSSAVLLPRAWLNQDVRVELVKKTPEIMLMDIVNISKKYLASGEIIGIYLVGSYARDEESKDSDIDILVISKKTNKMIHEGIYSILIISEDLLKEKLKKSLFPVGQMIKEARPLFNSAYLNHIKIEVTKKNVRWYIDTTKEKVKLIKDTLDYANKNIGNRVVYTLVLRIRTLQIIQALYHHKNYSKQDFIKIVAKISGSNNAYESYLAVKNDLKKESLTTKEEAEKLYNYLKKQLDEVKKLLKY